MGKKELEFYEIEDNLAIPQQRRNLLNNWHYKLFIKKRNNKIKARCEKLLKIYSEYQYKEKSLIAHIKKEKEEHKKNIYLVEKKEKQGFLSKIMENLFNKFDGWVFLGNKAKNFTLKKVKNISELTELEDKSLFGLDDKIGNYKNKPLFLVNNEIALSLNIDDTGNLMYTPKSLYIYINHSIRKALLKGGSGDLADFFKKNFIAILIGAIIIGFLFFTPQGKEFMNKYIIRKPEETVKEGMFLFMCIRHKLKGDKSK